MKKQLAINVIICIMFVGFVFQSPVAQHSTGIIRTIANNLDEVFAILIFAISVLRLRFTKTQMTFILFQAAFLSVGLLGTLLYHLQPAEAVLKDIVNCSKFTCTLVGIMGIYHADDCEKLLNMLRKVTTGITFLMFALAVYDYLFRPAFFDHSFSYYTLQLFYYHPAIMAQVMALFLAILGYGRTNRLNLIARILCLIMLCATFRAKAIAFALIYVFIWNYKLIMKNRYLRIISLIVLLGGVVYMTRDSLDMYYGSLQGSARGNMTLGGFEVANNYFPIGAGFGTYGTAAAADYYSPLYVEFGFKRIYGLGYINTNYATDTFWPALFGEFGYLGTAVFVGYLISLVMPCIRMIKRRSSVVILYTSILAYLLVCTTSGTGFFNPISVPYAMVMGVCLCRFAAEKRRAFLAAVKKRKEMANNEINQPVHNESNA